MAEGSTAQGSLSPKPGVDGADTEAAMHPDDDETTHQPDSTTASEPPTFNGTKDERSPPQSSPTAPDPIVPEPEARIPAKKDATLREFLDKMDDYAPIIPDAVTNHYLTLAGLPPPPQTPLHLARLLALATQKFVADIAADAYQYARIRTSHTTSNTAAAAASAAAGGVVGAGAAMNALGQGGAGGQAGSKEGEKAGKGGLALGMQRPGFGGGGQGGGQGRTVLTMEDLGMAVGEYGVNVKRGEFYR